MSKNSLSMSCISSGCALSLALIGAAGCASIADSGKMPPLMDAGLWNVSRTYSDRPRDPLTFPICISHDPAYLNQARADLSAQVGYLGPDLKITDERRTATSHSYDYVSDDIRGHELDSYPDGKHVTRTVTIKGTMGAPDVQTVSKFIWAKSDCGLVAPTSPLDYMDVATASVPFFRHCISLNFCVREGASRGPTLFQ